MRARFVGHVDGARQLAFAQKRTEMDIGQLDQTQAVQILGQAGKHQILLPQRKIEPLDENAVARDNRGGTAAARPAWCARNALRAGLCPDRTLQPPPRNQDRGDQKDRKRTPRR